MKKIGDFESGRYSFHTDPDVNIICGESNGKSELLSLIYDKAKEMGIRCEMLDVTEFRFRKGESTTMQVYDAVIDSVKSNDVVIIDLLCDLMHISRQNDIINDCLIENPDIQLFIVTNSPGMLMGGWEGRAVNIDTLKK